MNLLDIMKAEKEVEKLKQFQEETRDKVIIKLDENLAFILRRLVGWEDDNKDMPNSEYIKSVEGLVDLYFKMKRFTES